MEIAKNIVMVLHIIASIVLIVVVLMQSGKSAGLSGSIAGGAETFFGKNKGKTLDAILRKWTAFFAILFLATSIALSVIVMTLTAPTAPSAAGSEVPLNLEDLIPVEGTETTPEAPEAPAAE